MSLSIAEYVYLALIELDWAYRFVDPFMFGSVYNPACYHICLNLPPFTHAISHLVVMNYHKGLDLLHQTEEDIWVDKINEARTNGALCAWVTRLLPGQAPYHLDGGFLIGSYNLCQKSVSSSGTVLLLRFPRIGSVSHYTDEKVAMEVEAPDLVWKNTTIPVPDVHAWGLVFFISDLTDPNWVEVWHLAGKVTLQFFSFRFSEA